jgi:F420-dependent oxidoreductase-like protein
MDLCLMIEGQEGVSWDQWVALAQGCEEHGISTLFRSDHYMNLDGQHPDRGSLDAWATLSALAAVTRTVRLGTLVSPATFRHPSALAKAVATADHVSGGRVELRLGAGWHEREHEAYGFPFADTKTRVDVLEEQLQIVLGAWTQAPFSFSGAHYTLKDLDAQPRPVQSPRPPLIIGGSAGPRSAALAARYADEYNTPFATLEDVATRKGVIARACEAAGRDTLAFSVMTGFLVGADEAELRDRAARVGERIGSTAEALLSEPPPGWIFGTSERAAEQLAGLRDAGVHRVMCQNLLHDDLDVIALIAQLASAVA